MWKFLQEELKYGLSVFKSEEYCEHNVYVSRVPPKCVLPGGFLKWDANSSSFTAQKKPQPMAGSGNGRLRSQESWGQSTAYYFVGKFHPITCHESTEGG
jgi:hypothetical protein